jgi:hypothetical protein
MGQRHQSRRRRSYGRRQHEVRERRGRRQPWPIDVESSSDLDAPEPGQSLGDFFGGRFRLVEGT